MRRQMLTLVLAMLPASLPAAAHDCSGEPIRPYAIEKTCEDDGLSCRVRMVYAPGQNPGLARHGSYWYQRAERFVRVASPDDCGYVATGAPRLGEGGDNDLDLKPDAGS